MYSLTTEQSFDAAHFLKGYDGKCSALHGHRWRVLIELRRATLQTSGPKRGMLLDFGEVKAALQQLCDHLDHCLIYERGSLRPTTVAALTDEGFRLVEVDFTPTAEHFARYFYEQMCRRGFPVHRATVYETPNNCAAYEEDA
ncbi:MAG: 6-carboxytetrahydropterin synthase [Eubacteriales bacterium]|nr:6-carboxytetrahydropterin synthase [Eubacteriales bacterium]